MNDRSTEFAGDNVTPVIIEIADETLAAMDKICASAKAKASEGIVGQGAALGTVNSFTDAGAGGALYRAQEQQRLAAHQLAHEPLIARVRTRSEEGIIKTFYFTRNFTLSVPGLALTSYNSGAPVGRLASLEVGDEFTMPGGKSVEVIERGTYKPILSGGIWDGIDNQIASEAFPKLSVSSLRALGHLDSLEDTSVDDFFADFEDPPAWTSTPKRAFLSGVGLRDQTVMNKVQDEIFRLPIDRQVMLEGPPGTGKTTTLIKRLSQKLVLNQERAEDYQAILSNTLGGEHSSSWIMFSPTELLEHYLREAFARDNVPASQRRIQTWSNFRNEISGRVLGLLRFGRASSGFVRDDEAQHLSHFALQHQPELHAAFDKTQRDIYLAELDTALQSLIESQESELRDVGLRLRNSVGGGKWSSLLTIYLAVDSESEPLRAWVAKTRRSIAERVDGRVEQVLRIKGKASLAELRLILDKINTAGNDDEDDEEDVSEPETAPTTSKEQAFRMLRGAIRAMAVAAALKRTVSKSSKYRAIVDWLGGDAVPRADLERMGRQHGLISAVTTVTLTTRNYFLRLPQRYRAFRKQAPNQWFQAEAAEATRISPDELDLLVAVYLEGASELLASPQVRGSLTQGNLQVIAPLVQEFRNQVLVDEATDFSPLQLRAMSCLATPGIRSFFACGDFNQRLTAYGAAQRDAMEWAVPGLEFHQVDTAYRQSAELRTFANRIINLSGGVLVATDIDGPRGDEGYAPVVYVSSEGSVGQSRWIADRILEIERIHNDLPSIAVFVPNESLVESVTQEIRAALDESNIEVTPCPRGQVLGQERHVRVFSAEHIKGLEFEAAFFHSLEALSSDSPDLLDKFLYVGATRAATFLGLSASLKLPDLVAAASQDCGQTWE